MNHASCKSHDNEVDMCEALVHVIYHSPLEKTCHINNMFKIITSKARELKSAQYVIDRWIWGKLIIVE